MNKAELNAWFLKNDLEEFADRGLNGRRLRMVTKESLQDDYPELNASIYNLLGTLEEHTKKSSHPPLGLFLPLLLLLLVGVGCCCLMLLSYVVVVVLCCCYFMLLFYVVILCCLMLLLFWWLWFNSLLQLVSLNSFGRHSHL